MTCDECGFENAAGARFCGRCGTAIERPCPKCGTLVAAELAFCTACGARMDAPSPAASAEERKVVTVLFCDLVGFTSRAELLDPEDVRRLQASYFERVREELQRFGGTVEKYVGDAVLAVFGAPVTHEDDPLRAVRAALEIREAIADLSQRTSDHDLRVRIGVNTGEALVALAARLEAGEGMATGDVVNTASRLQGGAAPGGILVGEATYRATQQAIEYRENDPLLVKGKAKPVPVWEALSARRRPGDEPRKRDAPLVGREQELEVVLDALARALRQGSAQLVTLVGAPGIGKSRLVVEAIEHEPEAADWRQGRSIPYGDGVSFYALAEIVKEQAGIREADGADAAAAKVSDAVAEVVPDATEARWIEGHLRPLAGLAGEVELRGDRRSEAFAAWRRFFEAVAERRPLVLVFEDLHWADDGLLDFVDYLVSWVSEVPLLVVATARPELLERRPEWGGGKRNATTISLSPLSPEQTGELVGALLERAALSAEVRSEVLERAGGNPLYAGEYVRMLASGGVRSGGELPLPETVQGIIAARLDGLELEEKTLLQDAAVLGQTVWPDALAALGSLPRWLVDERLAALERKEFVRRERGELRGGERRYGFRHVLVRDVAYGQISRARRGEKHRLAAEWIESLPSDRAEDRAELLAHHYARALELGRASRQDVSGLAERARIALRDAGDHAASLNSFAAAAHFYADALALTESDYEARPQLVFRLGTALFFAELGGAAELADARDAFVARGDREAAAETEVLLYRFQHNQGRAAEAREHLEHARALVADAPPSRAKAEVLSYTARFLMLSGDEAEAIRVARETQAMAEALGLEDVRSSALGNIGIARVNAGDPGGLADLEQSIELAGAIGSAESVRGLRTLGAAYSLQGDLERSFRHLEEGRRAAQRFGDAFGLRWLEGARATELYWTGRWDEAAEATSAFIEESRTGTPHYMEALCRHVRGEIRLARGDLAGACEDAAEGLAFARTAAAEWLLNPSLAFSARVHLADGDPDRAGRLADELLEGWAGGGTTAIAAYWMPDFAIVMRQLGRSEELLRAAERVETPTRWLEAAVAYARGEFERAAEIYAEIGAGPEESHARACAREQAQV